MNKEPVKQELENNSVFGVNETIERGLCIGCGACAVVSDGELAIQLDDNGMYTAVRSGEILPPSVNRVCPFSSSALNEDEISARVHNKDLLHDEFLGNYSSTYAGRVSDPQYLEGSSSGGMTSWIIKELLERNVADAVLNVGQSDTKDDVLFSYGDANTDQITNRRKSNYYSVTLDEALRTVRNVDQRFVLVGVPCFIRAARLVAEEEPLIKERLVFFVGLVCGHMKSQFFAQSLAWQTDVPPSQLRSVDFRIKNQGRTSSDYDFGAQDSTGEWHHRRTQDLIGGNWGHAAFQPEACNFCDDIFAETADVAFGDAWLPQFTKDWRGTNIIVSRNPLADEIIRDGAARGVVELEDVTDKEVAQSQSGNFRHRRVGVSVRLADDVSAGLPVPTKRVPADIKAASPTRIAIIRKRRELSRLSFDAFKRALESNDLNIYLNAMSKGIKEYQRIERPLWKRVTWKVRSGLRRLAIALGLS